MNNPDTDNIWHTKHRTKTNTIKTSNTDRMKNRVWTQVVAKC